MDKNRGNADAESTLKALGEETAGSLQAAMRSLHPETGHPTPEATYSVRRAEVLAILNLANAFRGRTG